MYILLSVSRSSIRFVAQFYAEKCCSFFYPKHTHTQRKKDRLTSHTRFHTRDTNLFLNFRQQEEEEETVYLRQSMLPLKAVITSPSNVLTSHTASKQLTKKKKHSHGRFVRHVDGKRRRRNPESERVFDLRVTERYRRGRERIRLLFVKRESGVNHERGVEVRRDAQQL